LPQAAVPDFDAGSVPDFHDSDLIPERMFWRFERKMSPFTGLCKDRKKTTGAEFYI
jgi:hypothetical protein